MAASDGLVVVFGIVDVGVVVRGHVESDGLVGVDERLLLCRTKRRAGGSNYLDGSGKIGFLVGVDVDRVVTVVAVDDLVDAVLEVDAHRRRVVKVVVENLFVS